MGTFRRKYDDLFSKFYDRFIAMHATDKQGVLRDILAEQSAARPGDVMLDICSGTGAFLYPAPVHGTQKSPANPEARDGISPAPFPARKKGRHGYRQI